MANIEGINAIIGADITDLIKKLDQVKKALGSVAQESESQAEKISNPLKNAANQVEARYGWMAGQLASKLASLVNPAALAATAVTAIGAAIVAYYDSLQEKAATAEEALKKHGQLIRDLKSSYGDALSGLEKYAQESEAAFRNRIGGSVLELEAGLKSVSKTFMTQFGPSIYRVMRDAETGAIDFGDSFFQLPKKFEPFRGAIEGLQKSIRDGNPDYVTFRERVSAIGSAAAGTNPELNKTAYELAEGARQGFQMQQGINAGKEALQQLTPEAKAAHEALGKFNEATKALQAVEPAKVDALTAATNKYNEAMASGGLTNEQRIKLEADLAAAQQRSAAARAVIAKEEADRLAAAAAQEAEWQKKKEENEKLNIQNSLNNLTLSWGTKEEKLWAHLTREQELIDLALQKKVISEETHQAQIERSNEEHQKRLQKIREATNMQALSSTSSMLGSLQSLAETFGKKGNKTAKALGIAKALINTYVGATKALELPFPANIAAFGATMAQGLAAVASIRSVGDSGGGGGAASSGGASAAGAAAAASGGSAGGGQPGGNSVYINLQGQSFGRDQVRALVEQIASYQKDGGQVVFA